VLRETVRDQHDGARRSAGEPAAGEDVDTVGVAEGELVTHRFEGSSSTCRAVGSLI
jgi:hypothetical protein